MAAEIPSTSEIIEEAAIKGLGNVCLSDPLFCCLSAHWPFFFIESVKFLISRFQNTTSTKLYCTFGKNEGLPFKAKKSSLLTILTEGSHTPPKMKWKRERS